MNKLPLVWLKGRKKEEAESIDYVLRNNSTLINALLDIVNQYEQEEVNAEMNLSEYDSPSWGYKQADRNGARRAYKRIKSLFNYMETSH